MSLAIFGLFKALTPLFPSTPRRFAPTGSVGLGLQPLSHTRPFRPAPLVQRHSSQDDAHARPLRVMRWVDQDSASSCAGRMVMSGRFDDVCAELDRLVALESAREATRPRH
jgi:hypothetical protein